MWSSCVFLLTHHFKFQTSPCRGRFCCQDQLYIHHPQPTHLQRNFQGIHQRSLEDMCQTSLCNGGAVISLVGVKKPPTFTTGVSNDSDVHVKLPVERNSNKKKVVGTLPTTTSNITPENKPSRRKLVFQPSIFRCYVSFREGSLPSIHVF